MLALTLAQLVVACFSLWHTTRAASSAAQSAYDYVGTVLVQRLHDYMDASVAVVDSTSKRIAREGLADTLDLEVARMVDQIERTPAVTDIFLGLPTGEMFAVSVDADGYLARHTSVLDDGTAVLTTVEYDANVTRLSESHTPLEKDVTDSDWYQAGVAAEGALIWAEPLNSDVISGVQFAPVKAILDSTTVVAVVGAVFDDAGVVDALASTAGGSEATAFVVADTGELIAVPADLSDEYEALATALARVPRAEDLGLTDLAEAVASGEDVTSADGRNVTIGRSVNYGDGLDWVLQITAPVDSIAAAHGDARVTAYVYTGLTLVLTLIMVAVVLGLWRPAMRVATRASLDPLTGLANRYTLETTGAKLLVSARKTRSPVACIVMDLDQFKTLNDTYGHEAGDSALAVVGRTLAEQVRHRDLAARTGGDEFVILMRLRRRGLAGAVAGRVREKVAIALAESCPEGCGVGATAGFATTAEAGYDLERLIQRADEALIAGKAVEKGRTYGAERAHRRSRSHA